MSNVINLYEIILVGLKIMSLCERKTAVGESLAKGLEKGSEFSMNGFCCERVGEEVFSTKQVIQRFLITRRKVGARFAKMWRKQWLQIRNDSLC